MSNIELSIEKEQQLIKLLEYVPSSWGIEQILSKKIADTSKQELKIFNEFIQHKNLAKAIKNKINGNSYDVELYNMASTINIEDLILEKFDYELIKNECLKYLSIYKKYDICIEVLKHREKDAFKEAVFYEFERLLLGAAQLEEEKVYTKR